MPDVVRVLVSLLLLLGSARVASAQTPARATADLRAASGESIGAVSLSQAPREVLISIAFRNRTALVGTHSIAIHAAGRCDPPSFASAGSTVISLTNLVIGPAGVGVYNLSAPGVTLDTGGSSIIGKSLVVFADAASAGARIACGVIVRSDNGNRPEPLVSLALVVMGGLLIGGGILLRRGT